MKLLIAGSRSIEQFDLSKFIPKETSLIISGGAKGIDSLAEEYATKHRIPKLILYPNYQLFGKAAPLKRNEEMVNIADEILIIWDGISKGANYTIKYAEKCGKTVHLIKRLEPSCISEKEAFYSEVIR